MLVHAARHHDEKTICFGQDKDLICAQMAALNCCFFNLDAVIVWGDTFRIEKQRAWITRGSIVGGEVREVDPDDVPWPEASFEATADEEPEAEESPAERVSVEADGGALDQTDLGVWLE